jgi:hypothetical protein
MEVCPISLHIFTPGVSSFTSPLSQGGVSSLKRRFGK